jgi:hypothetical protein
MNLVACLTCTHPSAMGLCGLWFLRGTQSSAMVLSGLWCLRDTQPSARQLCGLWCLRGMWPSALVTVWSVVFKGHTAFCQAVVCSVLFNLAQGMRVCFFYHCHSLKVCHELAGDLSGMVNAVY